MLPLSSQFCIFVRDYIQSSLYVICLYILSVSVFICFLFFLFTTLGSVPADAGVADLALGL